MNPPQTLNENVIAKLSLDIAGILEEEAVNDLRNRGYVYELAGAIAERLVKKGWA